MIFFTFFPFLIFRFYNIKNILCGSTMVVSVNHELLNVLFQIWTKSILNGNQRPSCDACQDQINICQSSKQQQQQQCKIRKIQIKTLRKKHTEWRKTCKVSSSLGQAGGSCAWLWGLKVIIIQHRSSKQKTANLSKHWIEKEKKNGVFWTTWYWITKSSWGAWIHGCYICSSDEGSSEDVQEDGAEEASGQTRRKHWTVPNSSRSFLQDRICHWSP